MDHATTPCSRAPRRADVAPGAHATPPTAANAPRGGCRKAMRTGTAGDHPTAGNERRSPWLDGSMMIKAGLVNHPCNIL